MADPGEPFLNPAPARGALAALALSMLLASLGISIANVALPAMATAFSAPFPAVQWVVIAYLLASTVTIVGLGRLGDQIGHRRVLLGGIALFGFASLLCALAGDLRQLLLARAVQGIGAAILLALTVALVRDTVPKERMGSAMGLLGTMSAVGTALGPSLGGVLIGSFGWQGIFLVMLPLAVLNFVLVRQLLPKDMRQARQSGDFDITGTALLGLALAAYALAMTLGGGRLDGVNIALLLGALGAGIAFAAVERRASSPLIRIAALGDPVLAAGLVTGALVGTVMMTTFVVGPFYLARSLGLSMTEVGAVMAVGPLVSMICGVPAGSIVDRLGAARVVRLGLATMALGAFGLAILPGFWGVAGYLCAMIVLTPGYQLFQAANNTLVMMGAGAEQRGVISGLLSLSRNLGLLTGASLMGAVFTQASGVADIAIASGAELGAGMRVTFLVAAGLMLVALAITCAIGNSGAGIRPRKHPEL